MVQTVTVHGSTSAASIPLALGRNLFATGNMAIRAKLDVLVVDDHELVRSGVRRLLEENSEVGSITEASSGEAALAIAQHQPFDIILMDITLPGIDGLETSQRLLSCSPDARIIIVTGEPKGGHIRKLLNSGVRGYITKGCSVDEMEMAIQQVSKGEQYLSADVARQIAREMIGNENDSPFERLTAREHEIVLRLLEGQRNRQVAEMLYISEKTVSTHRKRAYEKLDISSSAELVRLAIRFGLWKND